MLTVSTVVRRSRARAISSAMALWLLATAHPGDQAKYRVGAIEFFGYKGVDVEALRKALPVKEGDWFFPRTKARVQEAVRQSTGKPPTEVALVCCDPQQRILLFVGVAGASYKTFAYNAAPTGGARLAREAIALDDRIDRAIQAAVRKGGDAAQEDDSEGYMLLHDPAAYRLQIEERAYAVGHEREVFHVLESSADVQHRRVASQLAGYATQSADQIAALVRAARDPDSEVRNDATRALGVLQHARSELAVAIPPDAFIEMLNAGVWTDRNKGAMVIEQLTTGRDPDLLGRLRTEALDSLIEMASWRDTSHAYFSRMVLGRIAGVPESDLEALASQPPSRALVDALTKR